MSGWKLVPVEPTPEMLDAMQEAGIAAFDADVAASLGDTPLDPTHARRAIWRAALDAAPEAPSAEPVAWRYKPMIGSPWSTSDDGHYISCKRDAGYIIEALAVVQPAPSAEPVGEVVLIETDDENGSAEATIALHHEVNLGAMLYTAPPDHRAAMRMALEALRGAQPYVAHYCKESIVTPHNEAINELKRALGEKK